MKATEPILDYDRRDALKTQNRGHVDWEELCHQLEEERNFFKEQYQKLYQSYCEKKDKIKEYKQYKRHVRDLEDKLRLIEKEVREKQHYNAGDEETRVLREEALRLKKDNEKLTTKLIFKNEELEKAYIQLQTSVSVTAGTKDAPNTDTLRTQIMESINHHFEGLKKQTWQHSQSPNRQIIQPVTYFVSPQSMNPLSPPFSRILSHHNQPPPHIHHLQTPLLVPPSTYLQSPPGTIPSTKE